ncbi:hypothetical protein [Croceivirga sp. JEA036]|uniref:hypothetical protein n=1 Tax=Croceivirga sp. JEA036 TaxID=2721162 RepID=UPI00143BBEB1|nr:hypothetical protein [Croceivirga sp. JEA036]NJB35665.1 hypothetical protein [Croceivirga sp. JEA036]
MGFLHFNQQDLIIYTNTNTFLPTNGLEKSLKRLRSINVNKERLLPIVWQEIVHKLIHRDKSLQLHEINLLKETPKSIPFAIGIKKGNIKALRNYDELLTYYNIGLESPRIITKQQLRDVS